MLAILPRSTDSESVCRRAVLIRSSLLEYFYEKIFSLCQLIGEPEAQDKCLTFPVTNFQRIQFPNISQQWLMKVWLFPITMILSRLQIKRFYMLSLSITLVSNLSHLLPGEESLWHDISAGVAFFLQLGWRPFRCLCTCPQGSVSSLSPPPAQAVASALTSVVLWCFVIIILVYLSPGCMMKC